MPDANDRIPPTFYSLSAERWERIFGQQNRTFLAGNFEAAHEWCTERGVDWGQVATGRHPTIRHLGMEPEKFCGLRIRPDDEVVRVSPLPPDTEGELRMRILSGRC